MPERLLWSVGLLELRPRDAVLEIGCGRGAAAELICRQVREGRYVGIDRSATAIAAARTRNAEHVASQLAEFRTESLESVEPAMLGRFTAVLAVNVNLFWVRPAQPELTLLRELLAPRGRLVLAYDPPTAARADELRGKLVEHLEQAGYSCSVSTAAAPRCRLLAVVARLGKPGHLRGRSS